MFFVIAGANANALAITLIKLWPNFVRLWTHFRAQSVGFVRACIQIRNTTVIEPDLLGIYKTWAYNPRFKCTITSWNLEIFKMTDL